MVGVAPDGVLGPRGTPRPSPSLPSARSLSGRDAGNSASTRGASSQDFEDARGRNGAIDQVFTD